MEIFIDSFEAISPQQTFDTTDFLSEISTLEGHYFSCITPKYNEYLDPKSLRRMSKIVKMGTASAKMALIKAGVESPDAIIIGTGLGCVEDTVKFLTQLIENNEQLLNPTAFIQSTHNTVSGQIALMIGCRNYNFTYTQKSASFESALLDAFLMLKGNEANTILVGGIDEVTDESFNLLNLAGCVKNSEEFKNVKNKGFVAGEGASFFVISNKKSEKNIAKLSDMSLFHTVQDNTHLSNEISTFLAKNNLSIQDIDVLISGTNGDAYNDKPHFFVQQMFEQSVCTHYKHLVGEYDTASAFSLFVASEIMKTTTVPDAIRTNKIQKSAYKNILIYNSFNQQSHSLMLVSGC